MALSAVSFKDSPFSFEILGKHQFFPFWTIKNKDLSKHLSRDLTSFLDSDSVFREAGVNLLASIFQRSSSSKAVIRFNFSTGTVSPAFFFSAISLKN